MKLRGLAVKLRVYVGELPPLICQGFVLLSLARLGALVG